MRAGRHRTPTRRAPKGSAFTITGRVTHWERIARVNLISDLCPDEVRPGAIDPERTCPAARAKAIVALRICVPPNTRSIALPRLKPGFIIPTVYAGMSSEVPGEVIAAAVAGHWPENR